MPNRITKTTIAVLAGTVLAPIPVLASDPPCRIAYTEFEPNVPHVELSSCPGRPEREGEFCRAQIQGDRITIYRFEPGPEDIACLADAESMTIRDFLARFGVTSAAR